MMTRALCSALLLFGLLAATAHPVYSDTLTDEVNAQFPPLTADEQRQQAITTATETLAALNQPNIAFAAPLSDIEKILELETVRQLGISDIHLSGDGDGLLRLDAAFDLRLDSLPLDISDPVLELFRLLEPRIVGRIEMLAGVTSETALGPGQELHLRLLPVFRTVSVEQVILGGEADNPNTAELLASTLLDYADNITGALARADFVNLKVPTTLANSLDPAASIHIDGAGGVDVMIGAMPVSLPLRLLGVATLITEDQIAAVAQLVPLDAPAALPEDPIPPDFANLREAFRNKVEQSFQIPDNFTGPWFAIRKDLIASTVNAFVEQAAACITVNGDLPEQQVRQDITFPDSSTVDCSPTRNCSPTRACDFVPCHDDRNCEKCLIFRPDFLGGGCIQRGNDPVCEIAKGLENTRCQVEAAGKKVDCERLKEQERLTCEAEKTGEKALCEAGKESLKLLALTGKFGILEAGIKAKTDNLRVCLKSLALTPDLSRATLEVSADGEAVADVNLKFTPLDIVGHLACQAPFTESRTFRASLRSSEVKIESALQFSSEPNGVQVSFQVQTVPLRLEPGPTQFLLSSPNLTLACQGLNLIKPLVVFLTPFIPQLRGEFDQKIPGQEITLDLAMPEQTIGNLKVKGTLQQSPSAIFLVGEVEGGPAAGRKRR